MNTSKQPDIDTCSDCGEHAEFSCCIEAFQGLECLEDCEGWFQSNCCGASPYSAGCYEAYD